MFILQKNLINPRTIRFNTEYENYNARVFIDNISVMFDGRVFQQTVGISMGTICAPLLANMLLYSYKADFIQGLLTKNKKKLAQSLIPHSTI